MLKGLRPPTHRVDAPGVLILAHDSAWDADRIDAECAELEALALADAKAAAADRYAADRGVDVRDLTPEQVAEVEGSVALTEEEREAARAVHPFRRYQRGETRFQLDAPDQGPRGPACAGDYLVGEAARFELRRIPWRERARIDAVTDYVERIERWVRAGLAGVEAGDLRWRAKEPTDRVPDDVLEVIADASGSTLNLIALAGACKRFSESLTSAEGKR